VRGKLKSIKECSKQFSGMDKQTHKVSEVVKIVGTILNNSWMSSVVRIWNIDDKLMYGTKVVGF
jgi:uncharacterized membrane protein